MSRYDPKFKPRYPKTPHKPKLAPPLSRKPSTDSEVREARDVIRKALVDMRWDQQGGYSGLYKGNWNFISSGIGNFTPDQLDILFAFAGVTADEIEPVGACKDCANADEYGGERGYVEPCCSCTRPFHSNFVPMAKVRKRASAKAAR